MNTWCLLRSFGSLLALALVAILVTGCGEGDTRETASSDSDRVVGVPPPPPSSRQRPARPRPEVPLPSEPRELPPAQQIEWEEADEEESVSPDPFPQSREVAHLEYLAALAEGVTFTDPGVADDLTLLAAVQLYRINRAMRQYTTEHYDHLPPAAITNQQGVPLLSWRVALLPYLGERELYEQFDLTASWDSPQNLPLLQQMPAVYRTLGVADQKTVFQVPVGPHTAYQQSEGTSLPQITDGVTNTIFTVIVDDQWACDWTSPMSEYQVVPGNATAGLSTKYEGYLVAGWDGPLLIEASVDMRKFDGFLTIAGREPVSIYTVAKFLIDAAEGPLWSPLADNSSAWDGNEPSLTPPGNGEGVANQEDDNRELFGDEAAAHAFAQGNEQQAMDYLNASYLVGDPSEMRFPMQWVLGLDRPVVAVRMAVGTRVVWHDRRGMPLSEQPALPEASVDQAGSPFESELVGVVGPQLREMLQERFARGSFGPPLQEVYQAYQQDPEAWLLQARTNSASLVVPDSQHSFAGEEAFPQGGEVVEADTSWEAQLLWPGMTSVGQADYLTLLERAEERGSDLLVMLDVEQRENTEGEYDSAVTIRLIDLSSRRAVGVSGFMKLHATESGDLALSEPDSISRVFDELFRYVDSHLVTAGTAVVPGGNVRSTAVNRLRRFMHEKPENPLLALAEARFYFASGVITDRQYEAFASHLIGSAIATQLFVESYDLRRNVVKQWLPGSSSEETNAGEAFGATSPGGSF